MSHLNNVRQEHKLISLPTPNKERLGPAEAQTLTIYCERYYYEIFVIIPGAINRVISAICVSVTRRVGSPNDALAARL